MESGKPSLTLSKHFSRFLHAFLLFSIGSLGRGNSTATVSAIVLDTAILKNTTNGLRIKTWQVTISSSWFFLGFYRFIFLAPESYDKSSKQGGNGYVKGVRFENVEMHDVANPIIIDQFYCDSPSTCQNQVSFFLTKLKMSLRNLKNLWSFCFYL